VEVNIKNNYLQLVNKDNPISSNYEPSNLVLVNIPTIIDKTIYICDPVLQAYEELYLNALEKNIKFFVFSGFRSFSYQEEIFINENITARPGYSKHQIGLALDISTPDVGLTEALGELPEGIWLEHHAHEYGFIIRYPKGKEDITKYVYEPWHIRYVGKHHARKIYEGNLTLEEYLE